MTIRTTPLAHGGPQRIEDLTRRELMFSALGAALLIACGDDEEDDDSPAKQTRVFEHAAGTTEIPVRPSRIVTIHDQNALLPLLELGVLPIGSTGVTQEDGTHQFRRTQAHDTSQIAFVEEWREPDLELITAQKPDLIVGYELQASHYEALSRIAPTVLVQVFNRPLTEALYQFADIVGALERWETLKQEYDDAIASLRADLPRPPSEISVSLLQFDGDGGFYTEAAGQAVWTVITDAGFGRPEPQTTVTENTSYSFEQINDHDADVMLTANFSSEGWDAGIEAARADPIFNALDVVQRGEFHSFDGQQTVGSGFEKMHNFIGFLRATLIERRPNLG